jgi:Cytochrome C oxidase subunit II, transmembrane domain
MQFFIEFDFNTIYDFISKLNINGLSNYLFSDIDDLDECCCGNCCSCYDSKTYMVSEKSWNFILIKTIGLGVLGILLLLWINFYNKENKISSKSESQSQYVKMIKKSDIPLAWGLYFQDGASPSFEGIVDLHNRIMFYLVVILFGVTWIMLSIMWNFSKSSNKLVYRYLNHGTLIELIWTVGPAFVLVAIAFPSFKLLYLMDEVIDPAMTVKVTGLFLKFFIAYINNYKHLGFGGLIL